MKGMEQSGLKRGKRPDFVFLFVERAPLLPLVIFDC